MGNKDKVITGQQYKIRQLEQRIAELESELYKTRLAGVALSAGVQAVIEQADRDRIAQQAQVREAEAQLEEYLQKTAQAFPIELMPQPELASSVEEIVTPTDYFKIYAVSDQIEKDLLKLGHPVVNMGENCWIGLSLIVRSDMSNQTTVYKRIMPYPGSLESIEDEIFPRVHALLARAPMREDSAQVGLIIPPHIWDRAMLELTQFLYFQITANRASVKWSLKVREVFERLIWPELTDTVEAQKSEYGNNFLKMVNRTFDRMESNGRGLQTKAMRKSR